MTEAEPLQLAHSGERPLDPQKITLIEYDEDETIRAELAEGDIEKLPESRAVRWINVDGTPSEKTLMALGMRFNLHPLMIEDIASRTQRSKIEEYDDSIFIVMHMLSVDEKRRHPIASEQISIVLGRNFVLTFQQREGDVFDDVRNRIKNATGRIRRLKSDYLAYRLLDAIVDNYFIAIDTLSDLIDQFETQMNDENSQVSAKDLHMLKRETLFLRRAIVPARELLATLGKLDDADFIRPETRVFLRDVYDHLVQVAETLEIQRGILSSMTDVYQAVIGNRLNSVMKVMTIVSTIFIPLSFIAGVYGMNFENMPELHTQNGYFVVLGVMAVAALFMLVVFKIKRWF